MRFLNYNRVLCLAAHPDDVEYGMLGSIMKYSDTKFDILVLSEGGNFDESTSIDRHKECESIWEDIDNIKGSFLSIKHLVDVGEDELINSIEKSYDIRNYDSICTPPLQDAHFEHRKVNRAASSLVRRINCGLVTFRTPSALDDWIPNFFVDLSKHILKNGAITMFAKKKALLKFISQQSKSYFNESSINSFHSNYQCSQRDMTFVESFRIERSYN
jgi:LmbE family N-acetylglucosaminyl deacetylase